LRMVEGAAREHAIHHGNVLEIAAREAAAVELAGGPAGAPEDRVREAAAREGRRGELRRLQVEPHIGIGIALAGQPRGRAAEAFAPFVVVEDDLLGGHVACLDARNGSSRVKTSLIWIFIFHIYFITLYLKLFFLLDASRQLLFSFPRI
jgi:hypothetical protein